MLNSARLFDKAERINDSLLGWLQYQLFVKRLDTTFGKIALSMLAALVAYVYTYLDVTFGIIFFLLICGIGVLLACISRLELILYTAICLSPLIFLLSRYFMGSLPVGVAVDILIYLGAVIIFSRQTIKRDSNWDFLRNSTSTVLLVYFSFLLIQSLNPNLDSILGYLSLTRRMISFLGVYFIAAYVCTNVSFLHRFSFFWMCFALVSALYGCSQEWLGFLDFELRFLYSHEEVYKRLFIDGRFRVFSFHSGPASFAIFMAISSLYGAILAVESSEYRYKLFYAGSSLICVLGLAYSGTRTGYAMVLGGAILYFLMTINKKNTLIFASLSSLGLLGLLLGPFYENTTINRVRSLLEGGSDASMNVRNLNRAYIQPYIYDHPIGGGLGTTGINGIKYNATHELAGFPPDSGYLQVALEQGWIGLMLFVLVLVTAMVVSIQNYYRINNPDLKPYALGISAVFFSIAIGLYAQEGATSMFPEGLFFWALLGISCNLMKLDVKVK